mmetsp:Transcript_134207/g.261381  ORF Transcript_134207/g.261381 Transcript_134207/m.261381 type:complete len:312 (-) Transcript_134207:9-944(-)
MGNKCGSCQAVSQEKLTVHVTSAQGLPGVDWFPGHDRFLYFGVGEAIGGEELFKSQQKKNVVDPVWNEECELPADMPLKFTVFQSDVDGNTDVLACATLDLASTGTDQFNGELPLEMDGKLIGGILTLKARSVGDYPAEPSSEFTVTIENPKKKALGLEVDAMDPSRLFVVRVKKGTVMDRFNETQLENKVDAGCFITSVTAADAGSITDMEKILKKNLKQVDLVCRRAQRFRVSLILTKGEGVGISVPTRATGNSLLITEVKANGAVEVWNTGNPDQIIELGDRIVAVNGKAGKAADLLKQIKAKGGSQR